MERKERINSKLRQHHGQRFKKLESDWCYQEIVGEKAKDSQTKIMETVEKKDSCQVLEIF